MNTEDSSRWRTQELVKTVFTEANKKAVYGAVTITGPGR